MYVIRAYKISKTYDKRKFFSDEPPKKVLDGISLDVLEKEFLGIMGESGGGKTTLLKILGTIDKPTTGEIEYFGDSLKNLGNEKISKIRRKHIGFVFQDFRLLDSLTVKENIILPSILDGNSYNQNYFQEKVSFLGIQNLMEKYPYTLSGGEKQRVAIMRALMNNPDLILADEPTGNLDSSSAQKVMNILKDINEKYGKTIVLVTHDNAIAEKCSRIITINSGSIDKT